MPSSNRNLELRVFVVELTPLTFRDPAHARGLLGNVLPVAIAGQFDLNRLVVDERSFVEEELRNSIADLLLWVPFPQFLRRGRPLRSVSRDRNRVS